ncbi:hypothetical protein [Fulvimarina manganoxydans]|uniref:hypothetical protein n=1 Tax=Fulvimarina manganoxydans TaxID=937218 RepID=UPI002352E591|nr:hypothetical protein [Fulvimarina manganoxydans]
MTRHRSEAVMIVDAVRLLNEASPATHDLMLEATPDPNFRFAALVAEAERYDEKLNVRSFEERDRSRDIGIDYGPDLSL